MLGPYLDGELETATFIELDEHIGACDTCREEAKLLSAMRGSLKRVLETSPPPALRERIGNALRAERVREAHSHAETDALGAGTWPVRLASWRTMVPLATAAAFALLWGAASRSPQPASSEARAGFGDDLLAELVAEHSRPLPPDATGPEAVRKLGRYVDVPVRPASFERGGARFVGGRVMPIRSQRAAVLQYIIGTGDDAPRVSVVVYDARKIQIDSTSLSPRSVGTAEVRVGREKGYSVAMAQRGGVGYLVTSDLDPDNSAKLAAMVYDDR